MTLLKCIIIMNTNNISVFIILLFSVVTSVSVIMDHGNGTKTYFTDGQSKNVHKPTDTIIGSPGNLLSPDRYEFYTFDETGDLVKRLMTLEEIHGLIAGADPESVMADSSPTYYHDALSSHSSEALMHLPASDLESLDVPAVHKVLESVQNVLKNEMAANSGKPMPTMPSVSLNRPDSASAWSALFPGLIETPDDVAHLSGYLLPPKTTEFLGKPLTKNPLTSIQPQITTTKIPSSTIKTQFSTTTEKVRSTPKYTTIKPELTTKFVPIQSTTTKPITNKKPFRPIQSFEKQKPAIHKPTLNQSILTPSPITSEDRIDINKEMSASISDMLSQVTDGHSSNHKPLQTNTLVEKDNTADYIPEESSPELSFYSPISMSTPSTLKPVAEALTSARKPPVTASFKTTTTEIPFSHKTMSPITTSRFGPTKPNIKPRPSANITTAAYVTKPSSFNIFNGSTTVPTTRNNYQYPPSNMSTKYMQKITQTTQAYPNKLIDPFIKEVNKTINNSTQNIKQSTGVFLNSTEEIKNKFVKDPNKVFQNKVTSVRPNGINRTNVTLSNRIQELKTTAIPNFGSSFSTTTARSQTEPDKYVSVKVEEWPIAVQHSTISPSIFTSTEKSFFSSSNQPFNSITDANAIRELISSLMPKSTTPLSASTSTVFPTTISNVQTVTTTIPTSTQVKPITGIPVSMISSTTEVPYTTTSSTTSTTTTVESTTSTSASTIGTAVVKTSVEATVTEATLTRNSTPTTSTTTTNTTVINTSTPSSTTASTSTENTSTSSTSTASTSTANTSTASTSTASTSTTSTSTENTSTENTSTVSTSTTSTLTTNEIPSSTIIANTTTSTTEATMLTSRTPESETQYVPVTHFLPELQLKDKLEIENNNNTLGVDTMLKDGISAVANMLQNTQKTPAVLNTEYQEIGERPYEKIIISEEKQSSTEQARKQSTTKLDLDEITTMSENGMTSELYEFTTTTESTTKYPELNDTIAMESVTTNETEEISRNSEPGLEMLTVFNVSSTGGPMQVAKLADLSAETQTYFDATTPFENHITTDPTNSNDETISTTYTPILVSSRVTTTSNPIVSNVTTPTISTIPINLTTPSLVVPTTLSHDLKPPAPSSNAYRPLTNSASPSAVELHPAPHESMGLEASVAFLGDDVRRFADLCNELSFKMWTAVTGKGQIASRSLVLSPFELTAMLAMVFLGARGSTSGQMNDILRLDDMVTFNPHQVLRNITHSITNINNPGVATASFVREIYSNKVNQNIIIILFYSRPIKIYHLLHNIIFNYLLYLL